jgi:hypothetical protein
MAAGYELGSLRNPGPGLFPILVGVTLLATSLALFLAEMVVARSPGTPSVVPTTDRPRTPFADRTTLAFAGVVVLYPVAITVTGFEIATAAALVGMSLAMGERRITRLALLGVLGAAAGYLLFRRFLAVPLP